MALYSEPELAAGLQKVEQDFAARLKQLRVGRARPDVFEQIPVEAYGSKMDLKSVANIVIESATAVSIIPWDKSLVDTVSKAVEEANLGYSPVVDSGKVRINIPPLTEETRKQTAKELGAFLEEAKVRVRQVRHSFMEDIDKAEGVSEDEQKRSKESVQKAVDKANTELEAVASEKEAEIMQI